MIGRSGGRGPRISVLAARHDDDDDIYIYILHCRISDPRFNTFCSRNVFFLCRGAKVYVLLNLSKCVYVILLLATYIRMFVHALTGIFTY